MACRGLENSYDIETKLYTYFLLIFIMENKTNPHIFQRVV